MKKLLVAFTTLTVLAAAPSFAQEVDLKKGEKAYKTCKACHAVGEGAKKKVGPPLNDLFGRTAGTFEGYKFSKAMKAKGAEGLVWNDETLVAFLKKPKKYIKGTKMSFRGVKDKNMANLMGYLKTFSKAAE